MYERKAQVRVYIEEGLDFPNFISLLRTADHIQVWEVCQKRDVFLQNSKSTGVESFFDAIFNIQ